MSLRGRFARSLLSVLLLASCSAESPHAGPPSDTASGAPLPTSDEERTAIEQGKLLPVTEAAVNEIKGAIGEKGMAYLVDLDWTQVRKEDFFLDPVLRRALQAAARAYATTSLSAPSSGLSVQSLDRPDLQPRAGCESPSCFICAESLGKRINATISKARSGGFSPMAVTCAGAVAAAATGAGLPVGLLAAATCASYLRDLNDEVDKLLDATGCAIDSVVSTESTPVNFRFKARLALFDRCNTDCAFLTESLGRKVEIDPATGQCRLVEPLLITAGRDVKAVSLEGGVGATEYSAPAEISGIHCAGPRGLIASQIIVESPIRFQVHALSNAPAAPLLNMTSDGGGVQAHAQMEIAVCGDLLYYSKPPLQMIDGKTVDAELHVWDMIHAVDRLLLKEPTVITGIACNGPEVFFGVTDPPAAELGITLKSVPVTGGVPYSFGHTFKARSVEQGFGFQLQLAVCSVDGVRNLYYTVPQGLDPMTGAPTSKAQIRRILLTNSGSTELSQLLAEEDSNITGIACSIGSNPFSPVETVTYGVLDGVAPFKVRLHQYDALRSTITDFGVVYQGDNRSLPPQHMDVKWCH